MPVMKQLRIGSVNYDTVGEASVTQVQTSGTKIATVTIDGTATDLYAPEGGGSGPEPSSTTPAMDGTAAVGTATTYSRADHVHPTDTSRVAASVTNANGLTGTITNTGSVKLESVTAAGKTSTVLASGVGSRLTSEDEDSESYAIVDVRTTYAKVEVEGPSGTSSVTVEPSGVSIDKLATPTTSTMPTTKQYVDDGLAAKQATLISGTNIKTINGDSILGSGDLTVGGGGTGGVTVRGARVTIPQRTSTAQSTTVSVNGLGVIDAHDIILFFGAGGSDIRPAGFSNGSYKVHVSSVSSSAFDAFAAIISPNYEVGSQASIVGSNASLCNTTTPLVGDTVTITATSNSTFTVYDAASGGVYAGSTVTAGGTYSFTVECATSYIAAVASGGGNN